MRADHCCSCCAGAGSAVRRNQQTCSIRCVCRSCVMEIKLARAPLESFLTTSHVAVSVSRRWINTPRGCPGVDEAQDKPMPMPAADTAGAVVQRWPRVQLQGLLQDEDAGGAQALRAVPHGGDQGDHVAGQPPLTVPLPTQATGVSLNVVEPHLALMLCSTCSKAAPSGAAGNDLLQSVMIRDCTLD